MKTPSCHSHSVKKRHPRSLPSLTVVKAVVPAVHAGSDAASAAQHSDGAPPRPPSGGGDRRREERGRDRSEGAEQRSWAEKLNRRSRGGDQGGRKDADEAGDRSWTRTTRKLTNN